MLRHFQMGVGAYSSTLVRPVQRHFLSFKEGNQCHDDTFPVYILRVSIIGANNNNNKDPDFLILRHHFKKY